MAGRRHGGTAYEVTGSGPPVVLVHGLGMNRHMWQWQTSALAAHFTVLAYDILGHGDSADPEIPCRMEQYVDQLAALADAAGVDRFGLVGFSLGGLIVQAFALAHPNRVAALAILHAAHGRTPGEREGILARVDLAAKCGPAATVDAALERWFTPGFAADNPEILDRVRGWILANDPAVYPAIYRLLADGDLPLATAIAEIRCPTLVLTAEQDAGNSPDMTRRMAALIPGARAAVLPGLRHMALAEDPDAVNSRLVPFLEEALNPARAAAAG
ncbi:MAG: alpha/beta fold hydrolase [Alphaproteobacteria bacterium]|nr:alpha/beta fold hydrolase [Alphaproteobacteria bacterium]